MGIILGPECKKCQCAVCSNLLRCHIIWPTTKYFCEKECKGTKGVGNCPVRNKENAE